MIKIVNIDGFARVITDTNGKIVEVVDYYFNNQNLCNHIGNDEIRDMICEIESKDAEVLIPITYHYDKGGYIGGNYEDPSEEIYVVNEYVLKWEYKQKFIQDIKTAWKDEDDWHFVEYMLQDYKSMYGEDLELESK